jgi:hypothetical protein
MTVGPPDFVVGRGPKGRYVVVVSIIRRRAAPDANLLVPLRNPVDCYRSDVSRRMPRRRLSNVRYRGLAHGFYAAELPPWKEVLDPSEMLIPKI